MTNNMEAVQGVTFGPALGEQCLFSSVLISSTCLPLMRLLQMEDLAVHVLLQNPFFFFPLDFENFAEIEKLNVTKSSRRAYSLQEMIFTSCCQTALVRKSKELSLISGGISCS